LVIGGTGPLGRETLLQGVRVGREIHRDKARQEAVLRESDLRWTIVRPAQLTNGPATGRYRVFTDLTGTVATRISRADVAEFLVRQVASDEYQGKALVIKY
jgi:uncharacterized protein YbjT (DUF2867 family)